MLEHDIHVRYVQLGRQWAQERLELLPLIDEVLLSGSWISGKQVEELERELSLYLGVRQVVALNSGTDALVLGLHALGIGPGDEVIVPVNSFIASAAAVAHLGATPIYVDVGSDLLVDMQSVKTSLSSKTKAIMAVHLTGRMCDVQELSSIAEGKGILLIEDCAQAVGSRRNGMLSGSVGAVGCFSTHPLKNLNASGDGGFVSTQDDVVASEVRRLRSHGLINRDLATSFGYVSRLDEVQAAILRYRLRKLPEIIARRRSIASFYENELKGSKAFFVSERPEEFNTFHTFVVQVPHRDCVRKFMFSKGVETNVHYPIPLNRQPASAVRGFSAQCPTADFQASRIISLPIHQNLKDEEVELVAATLVDALDHCDRPS